MSISTDHRILLDTVAAIALLNGNPQIQELVSRTEDVFIPLVTIGELFYGAEKSQRTTENIERVYRIVEQYEVLSCDLATARHYGQIVVNLKQKGRMIPQNDVWIAAIARQNKLTLVTRDAHFYEVDGLTTQAW